MEGSLCSFLRASDTRLSLVRQVCYRFDFQDPWTKGCRDSSCCYTFPISPAGYVSTSFAGVGEGSVLGCALTCFSFAWKRDIFSIMDMNAGYFRLQLLTQMGIERLVLPAIPQLRETWETSFGFLEMTLSERLQFLGYPFLAFQGTIMLQKFLRNSIINKEMRGTSGVFLISDKQLYTSIFITVLIFFVADFAGKSLDLGGNTSNVFMVRLSFVFSFVPLIF